MRKALEHARGMRDFPQDIHLVAPLTVGDRANLEYVKTLDPLSNCVSTESYLPNIDGKAASLSQMPREAGSDFVRRYIRFRPHIARKIFDFFEVKLRGYYVIGVHVRGTDGHSAPARGVDIPFDAYFSEIENKFAEVGRDRCRVFIATDEQNFISLFEDRFGEDVVYYDAIRKVDGDGIFGKGPTGQVLPAYITKDRDIAAKNGDDVVVEYGLLCSSDLFLHNESSISTAVRFSVPNSVRL